LEKVNRKRREGRDRYKKSDYGRTVKNREGFVTRYLPW
jgi:hypothetical protein